MIDSDGYLKNIHVWNKELASKIAKQEGIKMTEEHWELIYLMREFYKKFNISPSVRMLVEVMLQKYGKEKGNSCYLFQLFPNGPAKQATKIAGLPKTALCL